jgi:hypothetical protein
MIEILYIIIYMYNFIVHTYMLMCILNYSTHMPMQARCFSTWAATPSYARKICIIFLSVDIHTVAAYNIILILDLSWLFIDSHNLPSHLGQPDNNGVLLNLLAMLLHTLNTQNS